MCIAMPCYSPVSILRWIPQIIIRMPRTSVLAHFPGRPVPILAQRTLQHSSPVPSLRQASSHPGMRAAGSRFSSRECEKRKIEWHSQSQRVERASSLGLEAETAWWLKRAAVSEVPTACWASPSGPQTQHCLSSSFDLPPPSFLR